MTGRGKLPLLRTRGDHPDVGPTFFRCVNPRRHGSPPGPPFHPQHPLDTEGARIRGGRFNAPGRPALYLSRSGDVAWREVNPPDAPSDLTRAMILVEYRIETDRLLDLADAKTLAVLRATPDDVTCNWRICREAGETAPSQSLAERAVAAGAEAALYPAQRAAGTNLVVWRFNETDADTQVRFLDAEGIFASGS